MLLELLNVYLVSDISLIIKKYYQESVLKQSWEANPGWYDYMNHIGLQSRKEHNPGLTLGGGQSINMICDIEWSNDFEQLFPQETPIYDYTNSVLVETGTLKIHYKEPELEWQKHYSPKFDKLNSYREVKYKIYKGNYFSDHYSVFQHRYKLVLDECPMPGVVLNSLFLCLNGNSPFEETEYYGDVTCYSEFNDTPKQSWFQYHIDFGTFIRTYNKKSYQKEREIEKTLTKEEIKEQRHQKYLEARRKSQFDLKHLYIKTKKYFPYEI